MPAPNFWPPAEAHGEPPRGVPAAPGLGQPLRRALREARGRGQGGGLWALGRFGEEGRGGFGGGLGRFGEVWGGLGDWAGLGRFVGRFGEVWGRFGEVWVWEVWVWEVWVWEVWVWEVWGRFGEVEISRFKLCHMLRFAKCGPNQMSYSCFLCRLDVNNGTPER